MGDLTDKGQVAFDAYTYGTGLGWEQVINNHFIIEGGIGYTHSNLIFDSNFGNSRWSTLYVAPFFGWFNEKAFANFMVMGAFNFIRTHRKISFSGIERIAKGNYISYDLLLRANGGCYFNLGNNFLLQPEATLNYLTIFTPSYTEKEANSVSLVVQNNTDYIMQPSVRLRLVKEFFTKKFCYAPNIYVGWLANILLKNQALTARFRDGPGSLVFTIDGYNGTTNQLILGTEFYAQRFDQFLLTSGFEVDMLSHFEIYTVKIKFEWMF